MAFFSDALGHSALTGVALGVLLGIQNDLISMIAFGVLLALVITRVKSAKTASADTVISVFSSTAIALGLVILSAGGGFSKYSQYLIGDILSITPREILLLAITLVIVILIWGIIYNRLLLLSINTDLAASRGVKTAVVENIFVVLVAVVVMLSIKWVGVLLINSLAHSACGGCPQPCAQLSAVFGFFRADRNGVRGGRLDRLVLFQYVGRRNDRAAVRGGVFCNLCGAPQKIIRLPQITM